MGFKCLAEGCGYVARDFRDIRRHIREADHEDCGEASHGARRPGALPDWIRSARPAHN